MRHGARAQTSTSASTSASEGPLAELYRRPGFLLRHGHQIAVAVFTEECTAFDITPGQYGALTIVGAFPGIDQRTLARRIGLDASTTGGIVSRLVERGLILRRVGAADRRARALAVTEAGQQLLAAVGPTVMAAQRRLLAPFSPAERELFVSLLTQLIAAHGGVTRGSVPPSRAVRARRSSVTNARIVKTGGRH
jgi:DNA-binding MarR family transcriptional regulator